jgi:TonB family protein
MVTATITALLILTVPLTAMQAGRKIHSINDPGVTRPVLLEKEEPQYSEQARDAKIEGSAVLSIVVETDGRVYDIVVERGLEETLDDNAVAAVKKCFSSQREKTVNVWPPQRRSKSTSGSSDPTVCPPCPDSVQSMQSEQGGIDS